ncbi:MAG: Na(+)/H(+) antiporter subunit B [Rickettsiales bacterium]
MNHHLVIRVVSKLLIPFIILYGLYVQFHGDFGPGGGFQAGVIFASAFILYGLVFGLRNARKVVPDGWIRVGMASGVLIYGVTGVASLLLGGNYLDYSVLRENSVHGQHLGIFVVELGVGITVCSVMIAIFFGFAGRNHKLDELEE